MIEGVFDGDEGTVISSIGTLPWILTVLWASQKPREKFVMNSEILAEGDPPSLD